MKNNELMDRRSIRMNKSMLVTVNSDLGETT